MRIQLRIEGSLFGHLIGNALGARCKDKKISRSVISQQLARNYTEAGAMMLSTMSSLLDAERVDLEDITNQLQDWYLASSFASGTRIASSVTISQAIRMYGNGMPPDRCGSKEQPADNSALIRMLPIALWNANQSIATIVEDAHAVTQITNQQIEAQVCSALYCLIVRNFLMEYREKASDVLSVCYEQFSSDYGDALQKILDHSACEITGKKEILDSFWSTMKIVAKHKDSFDESIMQAILPGNDCEGTACLVGSLIGLLLGINDIPQHWLKQASLEDEAENVTKRFIPMIVRRNSGQN